MKKFTLLFALIIVCSIACKKKKEDPKPESKSRTLHIEYEATNLNYATDFYSAVNIYYTGKDGYNHVLYYYTALGLSNKMEIDTMFQGGQAIKVTGGVVSSAPSASNIPVMLKVYYGEQKIDSTYCANTSSCSNQINAVLPFIRD